MTFALSVAACDADTATPVTTTTTATIATTAPSGCTAPAMGPADAGSVLVPGPTDGLRPSTARGEKLVIVAVVLEPSCRPAAGAIVDIWHTDARGEYRPEGSDACCYYRGSVTTDHNGRFSLDTIRPAQYPVAGAPPAHIHLTARHASGGLNTEIVFATSSPPPAADPNNGTVPVFLISQRGSWYGEVMLLLAR